MRKIIVMAMLLLLAGCQVSHKPVVMTNPQTGQQVVVSHHGTTGKLGSAIAARMAHEDEVEALKKAGYVEVK
jgi:uncharacterized lipoprotein YajG